VRPTPRLISSTSLCKGRTFRPTPEPKLGFQFCAHSNNILVFGALRCLILFQRVRVLSPILQGSARARAPMLFFPDLWSTVASPFPGARTLSINSRLFGRPSSEAWSETYPPHGQFSDRSFPSSVFFGQCCFLVASVTWGEFFIVSAPNLSPRVSFSLYSIHLSFISTLFSEAPRFLLTLPLTYLLPPLSPPFFSR